MHKLGFCRSKYQKGVYFDRHDDPDVVAHRNAVVREIQELVTRGYSYIPAQGSHTTRSQLDANRFHNDTKEKGAIWLKDHAAKAAERRKQFPYEIPRVCSVSGYHLDPKFIPTKKNRVLIFASNDEAIFNVNQTNTVAWVEVGGRKSALPKSDGAGIMVCMTVCVNFEGGIIGFTDEEYADYKIKFPDGMHPPPPLILATNIGICQSKRATSAKGILDAGVWQEQGGLFFKREVLGIFEGELWN